MFERNTWLFIIGIFFAYKLFNAMFNAPVPVQPGDMTFKNYITIDTSKEPYQEMLPGSDRFKFKLKDFTVVPLAEYEISAMVVGKEGYFLGWEAELSPFDLALAWGNLANNDYDRYISYSQSGRWYFFRYNDKSPYSMDYIYAHSANTHIIPSNDNVKKAISSLNVKQLVLLKGYLVRIDGQRNGGNVWWTSSLSRDDRGDHSCEVFYVTAVKTKNKTYS